MGKVKHIEMSQMVELPDDALLKMVGSLWENIKQINERMKEDQHIQRVMEELTEYKADKYLDELKHIKVKLKASRALAKARGLKFELPKSDEDE